MNKYDSIKITGYFDKVNIEYRFQDGGAQKYL